MNICLAGINNYLGNELVLFFLKKQYNVTCLVRNENILAETQKNNSNLNIIKGDLFREKYSHSFPKDLDAAFYFSYYVAEQGDIYHDLEILSLQNYIKSARKVNCPHLVYVIPLRSPVNDDIKTLLKDSYIPYTIVRTSNIVGKNSLLINIFKQMATNFAIISNAKLAHSKCQPIALSDAIAYLDFIAFNPVTFNRTFDIGGPEILSYHEMITQFLKVSKIKKRVITIPFIHTLLSSYWLSISGGLPKAVALAFSQNIQGDILCQENHIHDLFPHTSLKFSDAVREAI